MDVDDENTSLDFFLTWRVDALKNFLEKRGLSKDGSKAELAALCFAANRIAVPIKPTSNEIAKANAASYDNLLKVNENVCIPDPLKLCDGWSSEKEAIPYWPAVYLSDITTFFMKRCPDTKSEHFLNEYKLGKAYEYFSSNWLKEVFFHPLPMVKPAGYCVLRANCSHSQRLSNLDQKVWVCVEKSGHIVSAYCSCTAGLGQTCNHIAGILFRLEHANRTGVSNLSCTSLPCSWKVPKESVSYGPKPISSMVVKKSRYGKSEKSRPLVSKEKLNFQPLPETDHSPLQMMGNALATILPNACLFKNFKVDTAPTTLPVPLTEHCELKKNTEISKDNHIKERISLMKLATKFNPGQEEDFLQQIPVLDTDDLTRLSETTTAQADSSLWHEVRKGRITASKFYNVYTRVKTIQENPSKEHDTIPLLRTLLEESGLSVDTCPKAIKHGRNLEPVARVNYEKQHKKIHSNLIVSQCGIFLLRDHQYLGASPDALVSCKCCGEGVLEIKCPLTPPCDKCNPSLCSCQGNKFKFLSLDGGVYKLKQNHQYYGHIQGQMAATGRKYCDFFVYTASAIYEERIIFNREFWEKMLKHLSHFYCTIMVPYLLQRNTCPAVSEKYPNEVTMESNQKDLRLGDTYFCPACNEKIHEQENVRSFGERSICCDRCDRWFHFKCVKITSNCLKSLKTWICTDC